MIRPSALNMAELCGYAPALADKYPETSDAAELSKGWHREIADAVAGLSPASSPEALAAVAWANLNCYGPRVTENKVQVVDPETLRVITEGTPDLIAGPDTDGVMLVVDWKKPGQLWAGLVHEPEDNLQLISYGLSTRRPFRCAIVPLDKTDGCAIWSRVFQLEEQWDLLDRVKRAASREPVPQPGQHCGDCYQRVYCHAYQARLRMAMALVPMGDEALDDPRASELSQMIDKAEDWVEAAKLVRNAYVRSGGRVVVNGKMLTLPMRDGRESADVKALKTDGLAKYVKVGKPYEHPTWMKAT